MQAPLCVWRESPPALPKLPSQHHYHQKLTFPYHYHQRLMFISTSLSSKIDVYFNITIITKDWPHLHMIDSEVDSLRYHHHHHHRRLTFISISLSSPKANWPLLTTEERSWRHVVPRAFATQTMRSPKPIETVMQFHSISKTTYWHEKTICDSRSSSFSLCCLGLGSANHLRQNEGLFEDTAAAKQVSVHSCLPLLISSYHFPSEQVLSCPAPVENILVLGLTLLQDSW